MQLTMSNNIHQLKILNSIVEFFVILMVNLFSFLQWSSKVFLHDVSMLKDSLSRDSNLSVSSFGNSPSTIIPDTASHKGSRMPYTFAFTRAGDSSRPLFFGTGRLFHKLSIAYQTILFHWCMLHQSNAQNKRLFLLKVL